MHRQHHGLCGERHRRCREAGSGLRRIARVGFAAHLAEAGQRFNGNGALPPLLWFWRHEICRGRRDSQQRQQQARIGCRGGRLLSRSDDHGHGKGSREPRGKGERQKSWQFVWERRIVVISCVVNRFTLRHLGSNGG